MFGALKLHPSTDLSGAVIMGDDLSSELIELAAVGVQSIFTHSLRTLRIPGLSGEEQAHAFMEVCGARSSPRAPIIPPVS